MFLGGLYGLHLLKRMYGRFHALAPDDAELRPSLPFVQSSHGKEDVEDVSVTKRWALGGLGFAKAHADVRARLLPAPVTGYWLLVWYRAQSLSEFHGV